MSSSYTNLLYHIVYSTKGRKPFLQGASLADMHRYLGGAVRGEKGIAIEIGGIADHVHMLVKLPPTIAMADFVRNIKANSSKWAHQRDDVGRDFAWQVGYSAFTVSESQAERVRRYVATQDRHHRKTKFEEELLVLLAKNRIEYDERYLWR
jgi:REP element-mobilizing transposase RayT